jgi:uncharacterized protein (TIGR02246 family)
MANILVLLSLLANAKADEAAVAKLPQQFADGYAARNGTQAASVFWDSPELVSIWPDKPSETTGIEAQRAKIQKDIASTREIKLTFHHVHVTVAGDIAWGEARWDEHVVSDSGKTADFHDGRYSFVARRIKGAWKIVAEHASLPYARPALPATTEGQPEVHAPIRPGRH